jgi:hypothetical protein
LTTGGVVRPAAELATGVQLGEHHLDTAELRLRLDVDRDAAGLVAHLDRAVGVEHDVDPLAVPGEGLVDGVVDDLPQAVHQTTAVGRADVHARTLADRLQPLQHEQVAGVVGRIELGTARRRGGHLAPSLIHEQLTHAVRHPRIPQPTQPHPRSLARARRAARPAPAAGPVICPEEPEGLDLDSIAGRRATRS